MLDKKQNKFVGQRGEFPSHNTGIQRETLVIFKFHNYKFSHYFSHSTKKMTFEMENLKWEMRNMTSRCKQSSYRTPSVVTTDDDNMDIHGM